MGARSIIIGMGNPLLCDDGVGNRVARELAPALEHRDDVTVCELCTGGIRLMESMVGYDRAFVVDAMVTGDCSPGTVRPFSLAELVTTKNTVSTHDTDLVTALEMGRLAGVHLPRTVSVWGIEAENVDFFSEELTPAVAAAVPGVVAAILRQLADCQAPSDCLPGLPDRRNE